MAQGGGKAFGLQPLRVDVVLLQGADTEAFGGQGPDRVDGRGRAGERRDARDLLHHRRPAHELVVEKRFPAKGRVDDQLDLVVDDLVADVRASLVHLEDDLGVDAVRA